MRICYAIDGIGLEGELFEWLLIAVRSVKANTTWTPTVLCLEISREHEKILNDGGAEVLRVRSRLRHAIEELSQKREVPRWMEGALLRYEAPAMFADDPYIICADCDTLFLREPKIDFKVISTVGAATSAIDMQNDIYNSGFLVFNVDGFLKVEKEFFNFLSSTLGDWLPHSVDQAAFNAFFRGNIADIGHEANWLTSFPYNENASVIHFHSIRFNYLSAIMDGDFRNVSEDLVKTGYIHEYLKYVTGSFQNAIRYLSSQRSATEGTKIAEYVSGFIKKLDADALLGVAMASRGEAAAARAHALALAKRTTDNSKPPDHTFHFKGENGTASGLLIYPCRDFGFGLLTIEFEESSFRKEIKLFGSTSVSFHEIPSNEPKIQIYWSGVGIDCHFLLTHENGRIGENAFSIHNHGHGETRLLVIAVEGGSTRALQ